MQLTLSSYVQSLIKLNWCIKGTNNMTFVYWTVKKETKADQIKRCKLNADVTDLSLLASQAFFQVQSTCSSIAECYLDDRSISDQPIAVEKLQTQNSEDWRWPRTLEITASPFMFSLTLQDFLQLVCGCQGKEFFKMLALGWCSARALQYVPDRKCTDPTFMHESVWKMPLYC